MIPRVVQGATGSVGVAAVVAGKNAWPVSLWHAGVREETHLVRSAPGIAPRRAPTNRDVQAVVPNDTRFVAVGEAAVHSDADLGSHRNPPHSRNSPCHRDFSPPALPTPLPRSRGWPSGQPAIRQVFIDHDCPATWTWLPLFEAPRAPTPASKTRTPSDTEPCPSRPPHRSLSGLSRAPLHAPCAPA